MKMYFNSVNLVFKKQPTIVWELEGDHDISHFGSELESFGIGQYTRKMVEETTFNRLRINYVKTLANYASEVNYRIFYTKYLLASAEFNDCPELYTYPLSSEQTELARGTVEIGTEYNDIVIETDNLVVPAGNVVCVLLYGNGIDKLAAKRSINAGYAFGNSVIKNDTTEIEGDNKWTRYSPEYYAMPALTLLKI